eukprot:4953334-Prymnesium_polylepis.1
MRTASRRAWAALTQVTYSRKYVFGGATCRGELRPTRYSRREPGPTTTVGGDTRARTTAGPSTPPNDCRGGTNSSTDFPKAGFQDKVFHCTRARARGLRCVCPRRRRQRAAVTRQSPPR